MATSGSVQFLAARISNTLNTENNWGFAWKVNWTNCSTSANKTSSDSELKINLGKEWDGQSVRFTTKKGAIQPNLTILTADDKCSDVSALVFNVTKTLETQSDYYKGEKCTVLASSASISAPCKTSVALAAVSSILSTLTAV